ncbi:abc transporter atp-binding protein [Lactobacillus selangorensis]|uniref:Abc transporter atp-binding protein n=1 Tax=Lactobacillus selangorensis TaxID=81857 RepID=A0A0R2FMH8_9LACO|nr:ATP-binding cassette domain-containing protein [Lactobacillus selangorensis]KRN28907.1 abc transporter atp-binding protein [Lactobacillus selangorensis]KRN32683.1 abc transporter atp-binding protein [Lactobacillus selangorensis]
MSNPTYQFTNLTQSYGTKELFTIDRLVVAPHARIGLIGINGAGKTTLLNQLQNDQTNAAVIEMVPQIKNPDEQSGGQQEQALLNQAFAKQPDLLLLDEPTANLDPSRSKRLIKQLKRFPNAVIFISHDRAFLDAVATQLWVLERGSLTVFQGNYSQYRDEQRVRRAKQTTAYQQEQRHKKKLKEAAQKRREQAEQKVHVSFNEQGAKIIKNDTPYAHVLESKLQKNAKAIDHRIDKLPHIRKPHVERKITMNVPQQQKLRHNMIVRTTHLEVSRNGKNLLTDVNLAIRAGAKVAITGPNGSGKSTLIQTILDRPDGVYLSPLAQVGYFSQSLDRQDLNQSIWDNARAHSDQSDEMIRLILAELGFTAQQLNEKAASLSGGERVKLALACLFVGTHNLLILDEPTNFLDLPAIEALQDLLVRYQGTILLVSHDQQLVQKVCTQHFEIKQKHLVDVQQATTKQEVPTVTAEQKLKLQMEQTALLGQLSEQSTPELVERFQTVSKQLRKLNEKD